ncbi:MAG: M23 family metallopeptidase [Candidatus Hydrogenedentes bacterium]|nr:M23 family metallopeptidase [Candidatus Hydrogenedentota bacterium]
MKRWTVMLIPQDRGGTQTFSLAAYHFWVVIGLFSVLAFASAFFFQRHMVIAGQAVTLQDQNKAMQWELDARPSVAPAANAESSTDDVDAMERRLRAEYEASIATITAELSELYDMEAKARDITGIAPRQKARANAGASQKDGQGGAPTGYMPVVYLGVDNQYRPPHVIYGLSRPSADLILQEIRVRQQSLSELVFDGKAAAKKLSRIPSVWPLLNGAGRISSRFGYRRDPIHRRVRHHDGTDLAASHGTKIRATAVGQVIFSAYDQYLGNLVKIDHGNGLVTWYAHMSKRSCKVGDNVDRSSIIGRVGSTGRSTGSHLHYEVRQSGTPVDGEKYLSE